MTTDVAAVHPLLWPGLARRAAHRLPNAGDVPRASRPPHDHAAADAHEAVPMLYRSEGFAEDLLDLHPSY